jgi:hypothetical protein
MPSSCFYRKASLAPSPKGLVGARFSKENGRHSTFLMRGFFLFLSHSPHIPVPSPLATTGLLGRPVACQQLGRSARAPKVIALSFLWGQWQAFFGVVLCRQAQRVVFFWGGSSLLAHFARALSWFSWRLSFVAWRLYLSAPTPTVFRLPSCLLAFTGFRLRGLAPKPHTAVLGVGDFSSSWGAWAYVYSAVVSKGFQVFFLGLVAGALA